MSEPDLRSSDRALPRRRFLQGVGTAGLSLGAASCGSGTAGGGPAVHTGKRLRWRLASSFPSSLDAMFGAAELIGEEVGKMSGGRFEIRASQAGEIVPGTEVLDAVQKGAVQMGQTCGYYYTGKAAALALETCVPFGLTARQQTAWLMDGGGAELLAPILADFNVVSLPAGNTGTQMGGWFRNEVTGLDSLKGLKMRIPGLGGKVMSELGVSTQLLAGGEIYQALERGAIDATEWVGPYDDLKLGFHEVAKHYCYPGWWEPGPHLAFYVNRSEWDGLPEEYRAMLGSAARRAAELMQTRYDARNPAALAEIRKMDVKVTPFSEDLMRGAREASEQLLTDMGSDDAQYGKIVEAWRKFRKESFGWFGTAELEYARFAFGG
ncbi:TRAP transporter substrate-binding protein DctP [Planctomycetes bacterium Poly30]